MLNDLLLELGTEELPSGSVALLSNALGEGLVQALSRANLTHGEVSVFATPRRLAVLILDVQSQQTPQTILRRGPVATDACSPQALAGFAKSCGVEVQDLTIQTSEKGSWWVYEAMNEGMDTKTLLPMIITDVVSSLPIAKPMRWGDGDAQFARPLHWVVLLFGMDVVPVNVFGINTNRFSFGHRYHHPNAIEITSPKAYEQLLHDAHVLADFNLRRQNIIKQVQSLAAEKGYSAIMPDALVDEVTSIVEWPKALLVHFEEKFLEVPAEALIAAMQSHQKCFALRDDAGKLVPCFITVANIASLFPQHVVAGNERVMRARLSDADFFFRQDQKKPLSAYFSATEQVMFQHKLGTLADKARRMQCFLEQIASVFDLDVTQARRAAFLSKCDLMTGMVGEFPELQGLMGYYYARINNEADEVAIALNEQYMPRFALDAIPTSHLGCALSLADRLDTLVGAFAIGQKPTGVKDPFKLRRHALAVVRILIAHPTPVGLSHLIQLALDAYGDELNASPEVCSELHGFILDRIPAFYQAQGITPDCVQAVFARQSDWLFDLDKRVRDLLAFSHLPEAVVLSAACKRVNNLLQQASVTEQAVDETLLHEKAEQVLFDEMNRIEKQIATPVVASDYGYILTQLASIRDPLNVFFEQVMVMSQDLAIRDNRLRLLARLQTLLQGVADISLLQITS